MDAVRLDHDEAALAVGRGGTDIGRVNSWDFWLLPSTGKPLKGAEFARPTITAFAGLHSALGGFPIGG